MGIIWMEERGLFSWFRTEGFWTRDRTDFGMGATTLLLRGTNEGADQTRGKRSDRGRKGGIHENICFDGVHFRVGIHIS